MKDRSITKDLFVSDLSFDAEEEDLRKLFALCGTVKSIHMIADHKTGQRKGCAYVRMSNAGEAKDALNTLDGTRLLNRCISVRAAQTRNPASPAPHGQTEKSRPPRNPRGRRK